VTRLPRRRLASGSRRVPEREASSTAASRTRSGGTPSAAGEALQRLPARVPRFWIWIDPTSRAAALSASKGAGSGAARISLQVVRPPMRISLSATVMPLSSGRLEMSMRRAGGALVAERGEDVRPAGQDRRGLRSQRVQGLVEGGRAQVHGRRASLRRIVGVRTSVRLGRGGCQSSAPLCGRPRAELFHVKQLPGAGPRHRAATRPLTATTTAATAPSGQHGRRALRFR
jgi:hypothetical protein